MSKNLLFIFFAILLFSKINAQTGKISGTILDSKTGETLPGATALIEGTTKGASADFDGKFIITGVPVGKATIVINYISYNSKKITDIEVKSGDVTDINVLLDPSTSQDLAEVEVVVTLNKENNTALVLQQKNNASVSDGISSESIKRTPDRNTSDVLKRVSGASIQENKFAIIRGLSDRYNAAFINGSPLPSSESDRKAFAFDIFPADMLDNLIIIKTATPDMPGEFAGGIININTKSIPEKNFISFSGSGAYNTLTTFKNFRTYDGGKYDWLGFDDGGRKVPEGIPETKVFDTLKNDDKALLAKKIPSKWGNKNIKALPQGSFQFSIGRNLQLFKRNFGVIFSTNYRNSTNTNRNIRREFEEQSATNTNDAVKKVELTDTIFTQTILNSSLLNLAYKFNENNQLAIKNLFSISADDKLSSRTGVRDIDLLKGGGDAFFEKATNKLFTQNILYSGQLEGTHYFPKPKLKFKYLGGYNEINRSIPNQRRMVYQKSAKSADDSIPYFAVVQNNGTIPSAAGNMFWADTKEKIYSIRYDLSMPLNLKNIKTEFKIGGMHQQRNRTFNVRNLGFSRYRKTSSPSAPFNSNLLLLPEDSIFLPQNLGLTESGLGGFKLDEATKVSDSYTASSTLHAGYAMFDTKIFEKFRLVGGVRLESYKQNFKYIDLGTKKEITIDTTIIDPLPSVNFIYSLNEKINIRLSYYKTLSRPEFRELAPFAFYNFIYDNILSGNPLLKRATIDNADLRFELYPGAGQILSVTGFYKKFKNPIELINRTGVSGGNELYYTNVPSAENFGGELEYRFKLSSFFKNDSSIFLNNLTLYTNAAFIKSRVKIDTLVTTGSVSDRPLQGQSPYLVNAGIQFFHPKQLWSASLSYNVVGQRIFIVGNVQEPDVWENRRHVIDFQVTKQFAKYFEAKINVRDALAQDLNYFQDLNKNKKFDKGIDNLWQETTFGQTITLSLSCKF
ncbi:MAG: carboxypeptidase-like regulatory domain-containing protein [Bacteroidota bacterium]|nr:carboxypeptidase-like regulatory domain-containing protein [Bacteroidota bacterium]